MGTPELEGCLSLSGSAKRYDSGNRLRLSAHVHRSVHEPRHCPSRAERQPLLRRPLPASDFWRRIRTRRQNSGFRSWQIEIGSREYLLANCEKHRRRAAVPPVAESECKRLWRARRIILAQIGLIELFEQGNRPRVDAKKPQRPSVWGKEVDRNSGIVLENRGAVLQQKIPHRFESPFVEEIGSCFEQAVGRPESLTKAK